MKISEVIEEERFRGGGDPQITQISQIVALSSRLYKLWDWSSSLRLRWPAIRAVSFSWDSGMNPILKV